MICCMSCPLLVLVVFGVGLFAGVFCFADESLLCWRLVPPLFVKCYQYAAPTQHPMVSYSILKRPNSCFRKCAHEPLHDNTLFNGISLQYSDKVLHLGHLLSFDLNDRDDTKDVNRKANFMIYNSRYLDPFSMTFLFKMYYLWLYGCILWSLSSSSLRRLQVAMNKILRKTWNLPRMSHTSVVLSTAGISYVHNIILRRFYKFVSRCLSSEFPLSKL